MSFSPLKLLFHFELYVVHNSAMCVGLRTSVMLETMFLSMELNLVVY